MVPARVTLSICMANAAWKTGTSRKKARASTTNSSSTHPSAGWMLLTFIDHHQGTKLTWGWGWHRCACVYRRTAGTGTSRVVSRRARADMLYPFLVTPSDSFKYICHIAFFQRHVWSTQRNIGPTHYFQMLLGMEPTKALVPGSTISGARSYSPGLSHQPGLN